jgi:electron transfer flavoprotein alpha subunit
MRILVIAELYGMKLHPNTYKVITAASQIHSSIDVLLIGPSIQSAAEEAMNIEAVEKILAHEDIHYQHGFPEILVPLIAKIAEDYTHILAPASSFGKNIMPRLAGQLDMAQISDVIAILEPDIFRRPMYAGNIIATVQSHDPIKIMTIRTSAFAAIDTGPRNESNLMKIEWIKENILPPENPKSQFIHLEESKSERPDLSGARVIVSGGRGLQSGENFKLLETLADKLGAAIGASRAAVDAGFVPNDYQIGQTGKIVAPELYIAIGISGAIQHLAGMKESKIIVAINQDPDAAIFQVADYGLVADLFQVVPELIQLL